MNARAAAPIANGSRRARVLARLALTLPALLGSACSQEPEIASREVLQPRATLAIEPAVLRIGDLARAEVWVETPPDHGVRPYVAPKVESLWLLDAEALPVEKEPGRWLHRIRIRLRPRDLGSHHWPESSVVVEGPDGEETMLAIASRELEVVSVLPALPDRVTPYSWIQPEGRISGSAPWWAAAGGAGAALLAVAGAALWQRRRRRAPAPEAPPETPRRDLFEWAEQELREAEALLPDAPRDAANACARIIRRYVASRFGATTRAFTTPELETQDPPLAMRSRWPYFIRVLRELDDVRFRPRDPRAEARLRAALAEVRRFVDSSGLPGRPS